MYICIYVCVYVYIYIYIYIYVKLGLEASSGLNPCSSQGYLEVSSVEAKSMAKAGLIDITSVRGLVVVIIVISVIMNIIIIIFIMTSEPAFLPPWRRPARGR